MPTVDLSGLEPVDYNPFQQVPGPMDQPDLTAAARAGQLGTLSADNPSWTDRLAGGFSNAMGALGATPQGQRNAFDIGQKAPGLIPGVGQVLSGNEAYRGYLTGDYPRAIMGAVGAMPIPGASVADRTIADVLREAEPIGGKVMLEGGQPGILAYHASRHDFPRFDINKVNTGEGTQDEGYGLYFAQHPGVAETYRNVGAQPGFRDRATGERVTYFDDPALAAISQRIEPNETWDSLTNKIVRSKEFSDSLMTSSTSTKPAYWQEENNIYHQAVNKLMDWQNRFDIDTGTTNPQGYKYQVSIAHDPDTFFDLNKTIGQQPQNVQKALIRAGFNPFHGDNKTMSGLDIHNSLVDQFVARGSQNGQADLAQFLAERNVPGIKYMDDFSERAGPFDAAGTLSGAPPAAQKKIMKLLPDAKPDDEISHLHGEYGNQLFDKAMAAAGDDDEAQTAVWTHDHSGDAAQAFMKAGIKANSGATHNYVIFNDKNINILKKYALPGVGLAGAFSALHQHGDAYQLTNPQEQTD